MVIGVALVGGEAEVGEALQRAEIVRRQAVRVHTPIQHGAHRHQVDIRSRAARQLQIPALISDVGDLQQARPRQSLRHCKAVAIGVWLPIVLAVHGRWTDCLVGDIQRVDIPGQHRDTIDIGAKAARDHSRRNIESIGELAGMVVIPAPASAKNGVAFAGDVVGDTKARLPEESPRGEPSQGNRRVAFIPVKAAVLQGRATGTVLRVIEDRVSESQPVYPRLEMGGAQPEFHGQPARNFPGILNKPFVGIVGNVVDAIE